MDFPQKIDRELTAAQFQREIFNNDANLLAAMHLHDATCDNQQSIASFSKICENHVNAMYRNAVLLGAAYFSLKENKPVGIIVRHSLEVRSITLDEIVFDTRNFYPKVKGPKLSNKERAKGDFGVLFYSCGDFYHYISPPRIVSTVMSARVFQGSLPSDVTNFVQDAAEIEPRNKQLHFQYNHFWHCEKGQIYRFTFLEPDSYRPDRMNHTGQVTEEDGEIWYDWPGSKQIYMISELSHKRTN